MTQFSMRFFKLGVFDVQLVVQRGVVVAHLASKPRSPDPDPDALKLPSAGSRCGLLLSSAVGGLSIGSAAAHFAGWRRMMERF